MALYTQCSICEHFISSKKNVSICKAFPNGIPEKFLIYSFEQKGTLDYQKEKYGIEKAPHDNVVEGQIGNYIFSR